MFGYFLKPTNDIWMVAKPSYCEEEAQEEEAKEDGSADGRLQRFTRNANRDVMDVVGVIPEGPQLWRPERAPPRSHQLCPGGVHV